MTKLSASYWNKRYLDNETGWDLGTVSPPIQLYFDNNTIHKSKTILIPGAGNAHEAEYLHQKGYASINVVDYSERAMLNLMERVPSFPFQNLHLHNFFDHEGIYEVIVEQTFFCALNPELREAYKLKMHELLKRDGILLGLLFNIPLNEDEPPYGGSLIEYQKLFESHFEILELATCKTSVKPRAGNELFFRLKKKTLSTEQ